MTSTLPSIVIVGRPNVGKSTLFNRLTGTRRSIVTNEPGITRDRIYGTAEWEGRAFEVVDTGGIVPEDKAGIPGEILRQARVAIENAARVVQVVDGRAGPMPLDAELAQLLRRAGKPPVLAVNKVDSPKQAELAAQFYELGDEIFPISAEHGFGARYAARRADAGFSARRVRRSQAGRQYRDYRPAERGQIDAAEPARGRGAVDCVAGGRHDARHGGHSRRAARQIVPIPRYRRNSPQGQDEADRRKAERDHGAEASGARRCGAAGRGCVGRRDVARRDHRELRGAVGPIRDHRDEQMGPRARSGAGKSRPGRKSTAAKSRAKARIRRNFFRTTSRWCATN